MILTRRFFMRSALIAAPNLLGKYIVRRYDDGSLFEGKITETEAYCGERDLACHASKGRTARTEIMYAQGGVAYVYLIYGMYYMLNFVTGRKNSPQAVLIRSAGNFNGPGRLARRLQIDKSFYGEDLCASHRLWVEDRCETPPSIEVTPRIGVDYAGKWKDKLWRFSVKE